MGVHSDGDGDTRCLDVHEERRTVRREERAGQFTGRVGQEAEEQRISFVPVPEILVQRISAGHKQAEQFFISKSGNAGGVFSFPKPVHGFDAAKANEAEEAQGRYKHHAAAEEA